MPWENTISKSRTVSRPKYKCYTEKESYAAFTEENQKERKQAFIFVPSVSLSETLFSRLSLVCKGGNYVSSKRVGREQIIRDFKAGKYSYLVTTAVLERGITVANLQVVVYQSDDRIYDAATLIQIAGRAGRKASAPDGDVLFLADHESEAMKHAISEIKYCNTFLQNML